MEKNNVLITSMPKAGTHLLSRIIAQLFGRSALPLRKSHVAAMDAINRVVDELDYRDFLFHGHFRYHHLSPLLTSRHWKIIVLVRDPRDVVLSMVDYLAMSPEPHHAEAFALIADLPYKEQVMAVAKGLAVPGFEIARIESYCRGWVEWTRRHALVLKYEELHDDATSERLAEFLDHPVAEVRQAVQRGYVAATRTRNIGKSERWREVFDEELTAFFKEYDGGAIERLGYGWDAPAAPADPEPMPVPSAEPGPGSS